MLEADLYNLQAQLAAKEAQLAEAVEKIGMLQVDLGRLQADLDTERAEKVSLQSQLAAPTPAPLQHSAACSIATCASSECSANLSIVHVRQEKWYGHWRHTVFSVIETAFLLGYLKVTLVGVKPPMQANRTNEEFPTLMQDLHDAYVDHKSPFWFEGREVNDPKQSPTCGSRWKTCRLP